MARLAGLVAVLAARAAADEFHPTVATGGHFSLFVDPVTHEVWASGRNHHGQLGIGSTDSVDRPTRVLFPWWDEEETTVEERRLDQTDELEARDAPFEMTEPGENDTNETEPTPAPTPVPTPVPTPSWPKVVAVAAGKAHSLFLTSEGQVYVTGWNRHGQLGMGWSADPDNRTSHVTKPELLIDGGVKAIAAGYAHSLFLMESGALRGVGWNAVGQLGLGDRGLRSELTDIEVPTTANITTIAAGHDTSFAVTDDSEVYAFGNNLGGQLGLGEGVSLADRPQRVPDFGPTSRWQAKAVRAGSAHALFLSVNDEVLVTGANFAGQLGVAGTTRFAPEQLDRFAAIWDFSAGGDSSTVCGRVTDGTDVKASYVFGSNLVGQLGKGGADFVTTPEALKLPDEDYSQVRVAAVGPYHSLFLSELGFVHASGRNSFGELGDGTTADKRQLVTLDLKLTAVDAPTTPSPAPTPRPAPTPPPAPSPAPTQAPSPGEPGETTRSPLSPTDAPPTEMDWTTIGWAIGGGITVLGLGMGCVAQGQAAKRASEDDADPEVELVHS